MLVLWRPTRIIQSDWTTAAHAWHLFAEVQGTPITILDWTPFNQQAEWERTGDRGGGTLWVTPHFVPSPALDAELQHLYSEGYHVVVQKNYEAVFQPRQLTPALWVPDSTVSTAFVAFAAGDRRWRLPVREKIKGGDIWAWLSTGHPKVMHAEQHWAETGSRSSLGSTYYDVWNGGELGVAGRVISGGTHWFDRQQALARWRVAIEGWCLWIKRSL